MRSRQHCIQILILISDEAIVKMLIESGADVNAQGGEFGNALRAAMHSGYADIIEMLIDSGADVNAQAGPYASALETPLSCAAA